jgi:hypothetical protein
MSETINGEYISKKMLVKNIRESLAVTLNKKTSEGKTYYNTLARGTLSTIIENMANYTLENMQKELASSSCLDQGYLEYISMIFNKNLYILDEEAGDVQPYFYENDRDLFIKPDRGCIVLLYNPNKIHYDLCVIKKRGIFQSYFKLDHQFIKELDQRLNQFFMDKKNRKK